MDLADILVGREKIEAELRQIMDHRTTPWGITVESVEICDITIPPALEDAMSRQAQAERERRARLIPGQAERKVAEDFLKAAARLTLEHELLAQKYQVEPTLMPNGQMIFRLTPKGEHEQLAFYLGPAGPASPRKRRGPSCQPGTGSIHYRARAWSTGRQSSGWSRWPTSWQSGWLGRSTNTWLRLKGR
jgi:hypothetical protein